MKTALYMVDTQHDFMRRTGALFVSGQEQPRLCPMQMRMLPYGAESIIPNIKILTEFAKTDGMRRLGSADNHMSHDKELQRNGGPFPDHCMENTFGQCMIPEVDLQGVSYTMSERYRDWRSIINYEADDAGLDHLVKQNTPIIFEKHQYDVFTNPNAKRFLEKFYEDTPRLIVAGVATDYCVKAFVLGACKIGYDVRVVEDAIKPVNIDLNGDVDLDFGNKAIDDMKAAGATFMTTQQILNYDYLFP